MTVHQSLTQLRRYDGDILTSLSAIAASLQELASEDAAKRGLLAKAVKAAEDMQRLIAEQTARIAYLEHLAMTDELTGLLNRRGFEDKLRHELASAKRYRESGVLVYLDLDGMKPINDRFGHAAGDAVLKAAAHVLKASVRETDHVARLGGDEFAVLLTRSGWRDGIMRAHALKRALNNAVAEWNGHSLALSASFGVQPYGSDDDGAALLDKADDAMYRAKRRRQAALPLAV